MSRATIAAVLGLTEAQVAAARTNPDVALDAWVSYEAGPFESESLIQYGQYAADSEWAPGVSLRALRHGRDLYLGGNLQLTGANFNLAPAIVLPVEWLVNTSNDPGSACLVDSALTRASASSDFITDPVAWAYMAYYSEHPEWGPPGIWFYLGNAPFLKQSDATQITVQPTDTLHFYLASTHIVLPVDPDTL